jgi:amino acid transporter
LHTATESTGLRANTLTPLETLSQSISSIAPTTTPAMTIPLVFALAGNGTWLAYLLAGFAVMLLALCIGRFARYSASPGSLYTYAIESLPPLGAQVTGWALLFAYIATGSSCAGGFVHYAVVIVPSVGGHAIPASVYALLAVGGSTLIAYREVQMSARIMLWIEVLSVASIAIVLAILL